MELTSYSFFGIFLPLVWLIYQLFHSVRTKNIVLLAASVFFYYGFAESASVGLKYVSLLLLSTLFTYFGGKWGYTYKKKNQGLKRQNRIYLFALIANLSILLVFKYSVFTAKTINDLLSCYGKALPVPQLLLPVGLSFFIFQSTSYLMDLINEKIEPENSFINSALFVSFFPTITSGPIQRARKLLPQIREQRHLTFEDFQKSVILFSWGAFLKIVLSNRLGCFVDPVFNGGYTGIIQFAGACAYSIQIYTDFSGYSWMAIAVAKLFGFHLDENFRQPYFAVSISDFWHRWHISLTSWFTEYLYFPLGGNRKGKARRFLNIFIVFLVSGLWHGAAWSFVFWGILHAIFQIVGHLTQDKRTYIVKRLHIDQTTASYRVCQRICVFVIATFAWIFFRASNISEALGFIRRMFAEWNPWVLFDGSLFNVGLTPFDWNICWISILILVAVSVFREKGYTLQSVIRQPVFVRVLVWWALLFGCLLFGIYGETYDAASFIYAGF